VGGLRASLYNALSLESVQVLVDFMREFQRLNGKGEFMAHIKYFITDGLSESRLALLQSAGDVIINPRFHR